MHVRCQLQSFWQGKKRTVATRITGWMLERELDPLPAWPALQTSKAQLGEPWPKEATGQSPLAGEAAQLSHARSGVSLPRVSSHRAKLQVSQHE